MCENKISYSEYQKIISKSIPNGIYDVEKFGIIYYTNGKLHRLDGPAVNRLDTAYQAYWINGQYYDDIDQYLADSYLYNNGLQDYL